MSKKIEKTDKQNITEKNEKPPDNLDNFVLFIQTVQISAFRCLMSALKEILTETNIIFTPQGIKIINMYESHTILVSVNLPS